MQKNMAAVTSRSNGLNTLRLVLALLVIVSHSFPLGGFGPEPSLGSFSLGAIAVAGFFSISGFLIAESRRSNNLWTYSKKRFFRILPGYWMVTLVVAFLLAPLISLNGGSWNVKSAVSYVTNNSVLLLGQSHQMDLAITNLPYSEGINGSLWTLAPEVLLYLGLGLLFTPKIFKDGKVASIGGLVFMSSLAILVDLEVFNSDFLSSIRPAIMLTIFFFSGAVLNCLKASISNSSILFLGSLLVWLFLLYLSFGDSLGGLFFAYAVLWLGLNLPNRLKAIAVKNDLSYGFYIYAFPVQHLLVSFGLGEFGPVILIGLSIVATAPFAAASWFWIERPFIRIGKNISRQPR